MVVAIEQVSSYVETYVGEFYFQTPSVTGNFEDAKSWCSANSSALAVVRDNATQLALTQFLSTSQLNSPMYINIKLHQEPNNTWYLVNGSQYQGSLGNQKNRDTEYKQYCYLKPNSEKPEFLVEASNLSHLRKYICDFEGIRCQSNLSDNYLFKERCYVKYEGESLSWYKARESCISKGGDLATFQPESNPWIPPFSTSWLNISLTYWVGIRYNGWSWKSPDDGKEIVYTSWSNGKPNNSYYSCVCVDPNNSPAWSWTDCDCSVQRPFVCLKIVPTTTMTSTTTITTRIAPISISTTTMPLNTVTAGLIVGLVLGIGVILPLVIIVLVLAICFVRLKRQMRENIRKNSSVTATTRASQAHQENSTAGFEATVSDVHYQHLQMETRLGQGTAMPLYDQLNQPEPKNYELIPQNT